MLKNIFINCRIIIASQKRLHKPKNYYPPTENKEECITWKKPVKKDNYWLALDFLKRFPGCPAGIKFCLKCRRLWVGQIPWRGDRLPTLVSWASLVAQTVKNPHAMWEIWVRSMGWKDPLQEVMAIHSSLLAWRRKRHLTPVFLPGKFYGQRSLMDFSSWGLKESDTTE